MKNFQLLTLVVLAGLSQAQRPSFLPSNIHPCVPDNQHCSVNADCCSRNCTSSTSKCAVRISNEVRPSQNNNIVNRFGECQGVGSNCDVGQDCCSRTCTNFKCEPDRTSLINIMGKPEINNRNNSNCKSVNQRCSASQDCCLFLTCERNFCKDKAVDVSGTETLGYQQVPYLNNRFNEENGNQTQQQRPTKCMDIGQKCYKYEDCCTPLKCHSFLHQCVT